MPSFRLKTYPELLATAFAHVRAVQLSDDGIEPDLNPGSLLRTILEAVCMNDADQYVQIGLLKKLFSLFNAKGVDLDARMVDFGSEIWPELKRRPADTSICQVSVGDGTQLVKSSLASDVYQGVTTFTCVPGDGVLFPVSGTLAVERGTERSEEIIYLRTGDVFTVVLPTTGFANGHSAGTVIVRTSVRSYITTSVAVGATSCTLASGTGAAWLSSGTIIYERGTIREEKLAFTRVSDVITHAPCSFAHGAQSIVIQATAGIDRVVTVGTTVFAPATDSSKQINFRTQNVITLYDGDYTSALGDVVSEDVGSVTRVGSNAITQWSTPPFAQATVTNPVAATRGRDREKDGAYLQRALDFIQSLSRSTPLAITTLTAGIRDPQSNRIVEFTQIVEPVAPGESLLYISDGTSTFANTQTPFVGRDIVIRDAEVGDRRGRLSTFAPFGYSASGVVTPRLFRSIQRGVATSVGVNYLEDTTRSMVTNYYVGAYLKTDDDQFYEITSNTAIRFNVAGGGLIPSNGSYAVLDFGTNPQVSSVTTATGANSITDSLASWIIGEHVDKWVTDSAGALWRITANSATTLTLAANGVTPTAGTYVITAGYPQPLRPGTDFIFNRSKGDLELSIPLQAHDVLVAASDGASPSVGAYLYSTGLVAHVQRIVNGDEADFSSFPGLRSTGTQVLVVTPTVISYTFVLKVTAAPGFNDASIRPVVQSAVQTYVNALGIGANIVVAEIIAAVMRLVGVSDCTVLSPSSNIVVPAGQIVRIDSSNVEVI